MLHGHRVVVVLPAYCAEATLRRTHGEIPRDIVDQVLLVDDASPDRTVAISRELGIATVVHAANLGYGANQKTCYRHALEAGADIVVMLHPDYQYEPRLISAMAAMVASASTTSCSDLGYSGGSIRGGMPRYKYVLNRILTFIQNLLVGAKLSEYHTGYRAFAKAVLEDLPLGTNSDDFVFDNQMLTQALAAGFRVGEISCPTRYFPEASSISFRRSIVYGLGVLHVSVAYRLWRWGIARPRLFAGMNRNVGRQSSVDSQTARPTDA